MTFFIYTKSGSVVDCLVTSAQEVKKCRIVVSDLPAANYDYLTNLGTKNRTFNINGLITGSNGNSQIRSLTGTTGSILFYDMWGVASINQTQVLFGDVDFSDEEKKPAQRNFSFECFEVI